MKIMVDRLPSDPTDCLFCRHKEIKDNSYSYGYVYKFNYCALSELTKVNSDYCYLKNGYCPYLKELGLKPRPIPQYE